MGRRQVASRVRPPWRALAAVVLVPLGACTSDTASPGPSDGPQLTASASYGRHAAVRGKVDVLIANEGPEPVRVLTWQVRHPLFETVPPAARDSTLQADGVARIVPVPFGEPLCGRTDGSGAVVVLRLRGADGDERETSVPLRDREPGLARAHRLACAREAVSEAAAFDLGPEFERTVVDGRPVLRTRLRLERRGPGEVAVVGGSLTGNILFTVRTAADDPLVVLERGQESAATEVAVTATRCEAHALTESKTSFTFALFGVVDSAEPTQVQMTVSAPAREALQELLDDTCGPTA